MWLRFLAVCGVCCLMAAASGQTTSAPTSSPDGALRDVPAAPQQDAARAMIRKVFQKEYAKTTPAERLALARLLLAQGRDTTDDPPARYVALDDCADLAAGSGDASLAMAAIDEIARRFRVDALNLRRIALLRAGAAAATPADCLTVMRLALDVADQAVAADAFDSVTQLVPLAEASANKTRQVKVVASIQVRLADLRGLIAEYAQVKAALATLERDPADGAAHLTIGRFYALHKGQWAQGLSHLAQGSDAELAELARRELTRPEDGLLQIAVADAWWDYTEKSSGRTRTILTAHAVAWYKHAQDAIKSVTLTRIQSRIEQGNARQSPAGAAVAAGTVELLEMIDPDKDAAQGRWTRTADGLSCAGSAYACLQIPYVPPDEYDLTVSFTRTEDDGSIALLLAAQKRSFEFVVDIKGEARFERVNGKIAQDNPTVVPVAVSNGRPYTLTVEVRKTHVRAILDGKTLVEWKTDLKDLTRYSVWKLGDTALCGLGANRAKVIFHAVQMVEVTGKGKPTR
jgi:hypothetical protein